MLRKCLFPAAGYGTRFLPATKNIPKEMMPIVDRPLIHYAVEEAMDAGFAHMAIITGRGKTAIPNYFDIAYELEDQIRGTDKEARLTPIRNIMEKCTFTFTRQKEMRGLGHAVLTGEHLIGNEPFAVVLADDLCTGERDGVLAQLKQVFLQHQCSVVAVEEVPIADTKNYGVIAGTMIGPGLYRVNEMVEKPDPAQAPSNLAIIGRYILTPDIFDILRRTKPGKNGEIQITDAIAEQARQGRVLALRFRGRRFDCGSIDGFVEATNFFYNRQKNRGLSEGPAPTVATRGGQ